MSTALKSMIAYGLGMLCLAFSAAVVAMGTPPQKAGKPAETSTNATMLKADDMRAAPDSNAAGLLHLEKGARVNLLSGQGGWSQIASAGKKGWVRVLSVSADKRDGIELSDLGALGKTPQGKVVAVAGARGLDEENLSTAIYNAAEIERLSTYAMDRGAAEQFALAAGLQARAMPYIDAPRK